jgi:hypothetical protein
MFAGRRGDILWKKPNFAGVGGRRDFDTYLAVGLVGPFWLRQPLHTFHWGRTLYDAEAIPLRPEPDLRFRAYVADWSGLLLFVTLLAGPVLLAAGFVQRLEERPIWILLVLLGVLALAGLVACSIIRYRLGRADRRDQAIRLLLGPHAWGSSDPAYWHPDLLTYRHLAPSPGLSAGRGIRRQDRAAGAAGGAAGRDELLDVLAVGQAGQPHDADRRGRVEGGRKIRLRSRTFLQETGGRPPYHTP